MTLDILVRFSDYAGVVEILDIEPKQSCGHLVTAKPLKTFTGKDDILKFWVPNEKDLLIDSDKYFAILRESQKVTQCGKTLLSTGDSKQTFFPFKDAGRLYILANRESFLAISDSVSYFPGEFVEVLQVIDERIYAFARWADIEEALHDE
ncbi:hypothetical protein CA267_010875 [Alteromonas pelagimontana]|uniref:Uncharacterized protein n=1 Tax=Alteromonas pelagimontana TaxID=1858656 RepID=A0A6M4MEF7_9ALTE|nr:hypothetical protein [Alteromonas pelagimontana]QJR81248.1 hypothetical protein CA267_010875 [Alteromonas pelagimontana]